MRTKFFISGLLIAGCAFAQGPIREDAPISKIFIPNGFDDNDNAEVILHGKLPSTCYHAGSSSAVVDAKAKKIDVKADVLFYADSFCIQSITPIKNF